MYWCHAEPDVIQLEDGTRVRKAIPRDLWYLLPIQQPSQPKCDPSRPSLSQFTCRAVTGYKKR